MSCGQSKLTDDVRKMVGVRGETVQCWGEVEREGLRRFTQALMDPDPRYWDHDFARTTKYAEVITPPIYVSYMQRTPPGAPDPVSLAFRENPVSDGIGNVRKPGALPPVPTDLARILNAGNEIEVYKYPSLGDRVFFQSSYSSIRERLARDGSHMLIVTVETQWMNHKDDLLCITRQSRIYR